MPNKVERIRARKKKVNEKLDKTSAYKKDKKNTVTGKKNNPKFERLMDKEMKLTDKIRKAKSKEDGASKKFPEIKEKNEGKFTKWVEKNMGGMDTCKAASKIMRSKTKKYSPAVVKMANYANNFGCKNKSGASMDYDKKGASFNPKLKKAVADGKIKGKFADAVIKG